MQDSKDYFGLAPGESWEFERGLLAGQLFTWSEPAAMFGLARNTKQAIPSISVDIDVVSCFLGVGKYAMLKYAFIIRVEEAVVGDDGKVVEVRAVIDKETSIKPKGK